MRNSFCLWLTKEQISTFSALEIICWEHHPVVKLNLNRIFSNSKERTFSSKIYRLNKVVWKYWLHYSKKDLDGNQSDFQAKTKSYQERSTETDLPFKIVYKQACMLPCVKSSVCMSLHNLGCLITLSDVVIWSPHWVYFAEFCKIYVSIFKKKGT